MHRWWETAGEAYDALAGPAPGRPDAVADWRAVGSAITATVLAAALCAASVNCGYWLLAIVFGAFTVGIPVAAYFGFRAAFRNQRAARWRADGRCAHFGYDLTGNLSGRCPECGGAAPRPVPRRFRRRPWRPA